MIIKILDACKYLAAFDQRTIALVLDNRLFVLRIKYCNSYAKIIIYISAMGVCTLYVQYSLQASLQHTSVNTRISQDFLRGAMSYTRFIRK